MNRLSLLLVVSLLPALAAHAAATTSGFHVTPDTVVTPYSALADCRRIAAGPQASRTLVTLIATDTALDLAALRIDGAPGIPIAIASHEASDATPASRAADTAKGATVSFLSYIDGSLQTRFGTIKAVDDSAPRTAGFAITVTQWPARPGSAVLDEGLALLGMVATARDPDAPARAIGAEALLTFLTENDIGAARATRDELARLSRTLRLAFMDHMRERYPNRLFHAPSLQRMAYDAAAQDVLMRSTVDVYCADSG